MIKEQGRIEEINNNSAVIRIQKRSACAQCESKDSCSITKRDMLIEVPNSLKAHVGDQVEVAVPDGALLKFSALVYMLPVIGLLVGAFSGATLAGKYGWNSPVSSLIGGGILIAAVFLGLIVYDRTRKTGDSKSTRMTRIVVNAASPSHADNR